jgi:polysaccharide deacetylase family protein (PEP-CTERM system associated)
MDEKAVNGDRSPDSEKQSASDGHMVVRAPIRNSDEALTTSNRAADQSIIFTLDLEDHLGTYAPQARFAGNARMVLDLLDQLKLRGTFFVVARIAETHPDLVRDVARRGHEIACHSYDHATIDREGKALFAANLVKAKDLLEQVTGCRVSGFRAPVFSLTASTAWAVDIIQDAGFQYSSSVLPARNPLHGFPGASRVPFRWPNGLAEFPVPVTSIFGPSLPFLGGVYFRYLPWRVIQRALDRMPAHAIAWTYLHPYDFDIAEPFARMPHTSVLTNLICWMHRGGTAARVARLFSARSSTRFCEVMAGDAVAFDAWRPA